MCFIQLYAGTACRPCALDHILGWAVSMSAADNMYITHARRRVALQQNIHKLSGEYLNQLVPIVGEHHNSAMSRFPCLPVVVALACVLLARKTSGLSPLIDTSPTPKPYGTCVNQPTLSSSWCSRGELPGGPTRPDLKFGRQTIFGSATGGGLGWCGQPLVGSPDAVPVAVGTRYIPTGTISPNSPYCGQCMCIQILGADNTSNPFPPASAQPYYGSILKGRVLDLCSECEQDHIDLLAASPYIPDTIPASIAYTVGVFTIQWQFVDCTTNCTAFFANSTTMPNSTCIP